MIEPKKTSRRFQKNSQKNSGLKSADFAAFERLGITRELLARADVRRVRDSEAREDWGIRSSPGRSLSGIVFPYIDPCTGRRVTTRLRRDHPEAGDNGEPQNKYFSPFGDRRHLYFPPGADALLSECAATVVLVEAEKSALALVAVAERAARHLLPLGCGGCWGWRGRVGVEDGPHGERLEQRGPLPDLDLVTWHDRDVVICFDANASSNPQVQSARRALAQELTRRGARVRIAELPNLPNVNGPDDVVGVCGDECLLKILETARLLPDVAEAEAEALIAALENNEGARPEYPEAAMDALAAVEDNAKRQFLLARLARVFKGVLSKASIVQAVEDRQRAIQSAAAEAEKTARRTRLCRMPITPAELLLKLERFFEKYVHLPEGAALILALTVLNTYTFDLFGTVPYILLQSATHGCGKTTLIEILERLCARSRLTLSMTSAVLFRMVNDQSPTLLIDEAEILRGHGERADDLKALLHAGYKQGATVYRCGGENKTELQAFKVFGPKYFAVIGSLSGPLLDRCIVIHLEKVPPGISLAPARAKVIEPIAAGLREELEAYSLQCRTRLQESYNEEPPEGYWPQLRGRESEIWTPLLLHARLAGPDIEARALSRALEFSSGKLQVQAQDRDFALTSELADVLEEKQWPEFTASELVGPLSDREVWGEVLSEKPADKLKAGAIGRFLKRFQPPSRVLHGYRQYEGRGTLSKLRAHVPLEVHPFPPSPPELSEGEHS